MNGIEELILLSSSLKERVRRMKERSFVKELRERIGKAPNIVFLKGLRGVGKTTGMLQVHAKLESSIYLSADWPQVIDYGLYEVASELIKLGRKHLFIDEIHTVPGWFRIVKALSDQFPDTTIVATGSAAAAFSPERRVKLMDVEPMSMKEFALLKYHEEVEVSRRIWKDYDKTLTELGKFFPRIEGWYREYLKVGGFPISLTMSEEDALEGIYAAIEKSIKEDALSILKMDYGKRFAMERLLFMLATSPPGEMSISSLSKTLKISKTTVYEILNALENMKIIRIIRPHARGSGLIRGEPKMLFRHPNLRVAICHKLRKEVPVGAIREEAVLFALERMGISFGTVRGRKKSPDYMLEDGTIIEIGGPSKKSGQLKDFEKGIVVRDYQIMAMLLSF